jgi:hypothetical protein
VSAQRWGGTAIKALGQFVLAVSLAAGVTGSARAALAPPGSLSKVVVESDVIAVLKIEKVEKSAKVSPAPAQGLTWATATATVQRAVKGKAVGDKVRIEFSTMPEAAQYAEGEECLAFLVAEGDHYTTPQSMFGKYLVKDGRVMRWYIEQKRPIHAALEAVLAEIQRVSK